ncbi:hypothetical protein SDC9_46663 [bioreactor metagenome]|uniref:Uncharacterized protein n=1 Tax=bioreactor metagenome TaxID=1076179 RepID=A0A644WA26_9ZZZZ
MEYLKSVDKVKLNIQAITSDPDWNKKQKSYREYCMSHADDVFIVVTDSKFGNEPSIVCLTNNGVDSGWYFYIGDLIEVKENPSLLEG